MTILVGLLVIGGCLLLLSSLTGFRERKGLFKQTTAGSGIGSSLHELNALARPSNRHVMHVMQTRPELKEEEPGGDGVRIVLPPELNR